MNAHASDIESNLWQGTLGLMLLASMFALGLIAALSSGWNNPRPYRAPDWEAEGLLMALRAPAGKRAISLLDFQGRDFTLEASVAPQPGPDFNAYGVIYRAQDPANYYALSVGGDGYYAVLQSIDDQVQPLVPWQQFPHVRRGAQANRLRVSCAGANCTFYINDEYATTVQDDTWLSGAVGAWGQSFDGGENTFKFSSIRVWE